MPIQSLKNQQSHIKVIYIVISVIFISQQGPICFHEETFSCLRAILKAAAGKL